MQLYIDVAEEKNGTFHKLSMFAFSISGKCSKCRGS